MCKFKSMKEQIEQSKRKSQLTNSGKPKLQRANTSQTGHKHLFDNDNDLRDVKSEEEFFGAEFKETEFFECNPSPNIRPELDEEEEKMKCDVDEDDEVPTESDDSGHKTGIANQVGISPINNARPFGAQQTSQKYKGADKIATSLPMLQKRNKDDEYDLLDITKFRSNFTHFIGSRKPYEVSEKLEKEINNIGG